MKEVNFDFVNACCTDSGLNAVLFENAIKDRADLDSLRDRLQRYVAKAKVLGIDMDVDLGALKLNEIKNLEAKSFTLPPVMIIGQHALETCTIEELIIPDTVVLIDIGGISSSGLKRLHIGDGVRKINNYGISKVYKEFDYLYVGKCMDAENYDRILAFRDMEFVEINEIEISPENPFLRIMDGVIYNKDITKLFRYPINKKDPVFIMPDTVTEVSLKSSLIANDHLVEIKLSDNLIIMPSFGDDSSKLKHIVFGKKTCIILCARGMVLMSPKVTIDVYSGLLIFVAPGTLAIAKDLEIRMHTDNPKVCKLVFTSEGDYEIVECKNGLKLRDEHFLSEQKEHKVSTIPEKFRVSILDENGRVIYQETAEV